MSKVHSTTYFWILELVCGYFYLSVGFLIVDTYFDFANIFWPAKSELVKEWVFNIMHCHFDGRFVGLTVPPLCIIAPKVYYSKIWKKVQIRKCVHFKNKINFFENISKWRGPECL